MSRTSALNELLVPTGPTSHDNSEKTYSNGLLSSFRSGCVSCVSSPPAQYFLLVVNFIIALGLQIQPVVDTSKKIDCMRWVVIITALLASPVTFFSKKKSTVRRPSDVKELKAIKRILNDDAVSASMHANTSSCLGAAQGVFDFSAYFVLLIAFCQTLVALNNDMIKTMPIDDSSFNLGMGVTLTGTSILSLINVIVLNQFRLKGSRPGLEAIGQVNSRSCVPYLMYLGVLLWGYSQQNLYRGGKAFISIVNITRQWQNTTGLTDAAASDQFYASLCGWFSVVMYVPLTIAGSSLAFYRFNPKKLFDQVSSDWQEFSFVERFFFELSIVLQAANVFSVVVASFYQSQDLGQSFPLSICNMISCLVMALNNSVFIFGQLLQKDLKDLSRKVERYMDQGDSYSIFTDGSGEISFKDKSGSDMPISKLRQRIENGASSSPPVCF
jgi:hypothetical protein